MEIILVELRNLIFLCTGKNCNYLHGMPMEPVA